MKLDSVDMRILILLKKFDRGLTTSEIAKLLFKIDNSDELKKKDQYVREKIKKFISRNIIIESLDDITCKKRYKLSDKAHVIFGEGILTVINKKENINEHFDLGEVIVVKENSKWLHIEVL